MPIGTVKWFNATKGFGFIQPDTGGPDVFVHISAVERAGLRGLNDGQKISYEEQRDPKRFSGRVVQPSPFRYILKCPIAVVVKRR